MAIADLSTLGTAQNKTSGTTLALTVTAGVAIGETIIVNVVCDNVDTTDSDTTLISLADSKGNTYTRVRERTKGSGAAAAGLTVAQFYTVATVALVSATDTITATLSSARVAKAMNAAKSPTELVETTDYAASANGTAPSVSTGTLTSKEYMLVAGVGIELNSLGLVTNDADYSGTYSIRTSGGGGATNVSMHVSRRIATLTTDTYACTINSADWCVVLGVFEEAGGPTYDETGREVSVAGTVSGTDSLGLTDATSLQATSTIDSTDRADFADATSVTVAATVTGSDARSLTESTAVAASATVMASDLWGVTEPVEVVATGTVTATDRIDTAETVEVSVVATVTSTDVYTGGSTNYNETGREVVVTATVSATDVRSLTEAVEVVASSTVSASDLRSLTESTAVSVQATVASSDRAGYVSSVEVSVAATVSATDVYTGGSTNYDETGRQVVASATLSATDSHARTEATSVSAQVTTYVTDARALFEASEVIGTVSIDSEATQRLSQAFEVSVQATVTATDVLNQAAAVEAVLITGYVTISVTDHLTDRWRRASTPLASKTLMSTGGLRGRGGRRR